MKLETSFDHVWFVREHIDKIVKLTGAGIRCPDLSSLKELPKKYSIWIRGSMDGVYAASFLLTVRMHSSPPAIDINVLINSGFASAAAHVSGVPRSH